jgi:probable rRNA maturation factor
VRLVPRRVLARSIATALAAAGAPEPCTVGLILSDDRELARLNADHMGSARPTDVLSFPLLPPGAFPSHPGQPPEIRAGTPSTFALPPGRRIHLGEIVVSVERAVAQAEDGRGGQTGDRRWTPAEELRLLVTHGALHLCGWDHAEAAEERAMRELEDRLLSTPRPTSARGRRSAPGG